MHKKPIIHNPLHAYLQRRQMRATEFAAALARVRGVLSSEAQVSRWRHGRLIPNRAMQIAIERATKGGVTPSQWAGYAKAIGYRDQRVCRPLKG